MKTVFSTVMRKATQLTRARNAIEAARLIQRTLAATRHKVSAGEQPRQNVRDARAGLQDTVTDQRSPTRVKEPLGEVLERLRKTDFSGFRFDPALLAKSRKAPLVPVPDGAAYLSRSFTCEAGSRDYKVYVPSHAMEHKRPLLIMLHGCTQNPGDFAAGTKMNRLAEEHGFIVTYPEQPVSANQTSCWNWFDRKDQMRDAGEPCIIAGITRVLTEEFCIDAGRVYVAGLSAGGAMAAIMGAAYPDLYAAIGIHSGLARGAATDLVSAYAAMRGTAAPELSPQGQIDTGNATVRTIVFHGAADRLVHPSNAEAIVAMARTSLTGPWRETQQAGSAGGRAYTRLVIRDTGESPQVEYWAIAGLAHAWSGGSPEGSHTDPHGPDASREMLRFFLAAPPPAGTR